jgi:hypothetical protein
VSILGLKLRRVIRTPLSDKGKPGETRGRKASGLNRESGTVAGFPNEKLRSDTMQVRHIMGTSAMAASSSQGWATNLAADIRDEQRERRRHAHRPEGPRPAQRSQAGPVSAAHRDGHPGWAAMGRPHLSRRRSQAFFKWANATRLSR